MSQVLSVQIWTPLYKTKQISISGHSWCCFYVSVFSSMWYFQTWRNCKPLVMCRTFDLVGCLYLLTWDCHRRIWVWKYSFQPSCHSGTTKYGITPKLFPSEVESPPPFARLESPGSYSWLSIKANDSCVAWSLLVWSLVCVFICKHSVCAVCKQVHTVLDFILWSGKELLDFQNLK